MESLFEEVKSRHVPITRSHTREVDLSSANQVVLSYTILQSNVSKICTEQHKIEQVSAKKAIFERLHSITRRSDVGLKTHPSFLSECVKTLGKHEN